MSREPQQSSSGVLEPMRSADSAGSTEQTLEGSNLAKDSRQRDLRHDEEAQAGEGSEESALPHGDQKEVFEVGWDGGDDDPACPRSFNTARKWLITIIVSSCGFCV